eukprot:3228302-Heterocapsa_arctica.AAC.1
MGGHPGVVGTPVRSTVETRGPKGRPGVADMSVGSMRGATGLQGSPGVVVSGGVDSAASQSAA